MKHMVALLALAVGFAAALIARPSNRSLRKIERLARARMVSRLESREPIPVARIVQESLPGNGQHAERANALIISLAKLLQVEPTSLRPDDRLGELLKVTAEEIPEVSLDEWDHTGLKKFIVLGAYDLMHLVEAWSDRKSWSRKRDSLVQPPRNEEEWLDLILDMSVADFLRFFAPLAKGATESRVI
jgi:hypothetical protein